MSPQNLLDTGLARGRDGQLLLSQSPAQVCKGPGSSACQGAEKVALDPARVRVDGPEETSAPWRDHLSKLSWLMAHLSAKSLVSLQLRKLSVPLELVLFCYIFILLLLVLAPCLLCILLWLGR